MSYASPSRQTPRTALWRWVFCLAVATFLCRALIPNGYMPASAAAQGTPILGLCTGTEIGFAADPRAGHGTGHPGDGHPDHRLCPFSLAAAHAALPVQPGLAVMALLARYLVLQTPQAQLGIAPPVAGPPLGSRAPPPNPA